MNLIIFCDIPAYTKDLNNQKKSYRNSSLSKVCLIHYIIDNSCRSYIILLRLEDPYNKSDLLNFFSSLTPPVLRYHPS